MCAPVHRDFVRSLWNVSSSICIWYKRKIQNLMFLLYVDNVEYYNVEYQIWRFCCNLFLSYADKRHADIHTHRHTGTQIHRPNAKNVFSKRVSPSKYPLRKFDPKNNAFYIYRQEKVKYCAKYKFDSPEPYHMQMILQSFYQIRTNILCRGAYTRIQIQYNL